MPFLSIDVPNALGDRTAAWRWARIAGGGKVEQTPGKSLAGFGADSTTAAAGAKCLSLHRLDTVAVFGTHLEFAVERCQSARRRRRR